MAALRIFVSSTCYDLGVVRAKIRQFLLAQGHDPVLSEFSDVLFDPNAHTHRSCLNEVNGCDLVLLLVGSRFGGTSLPASLAEIDFPALEKLSAGKGIFEESCRTSVTQAEVLKAIHQDIPVYPFVDERVMSDHHVYEKNRASGLSDKITYPSIDNQATAKYVFEFINFLRLKYTGNAIYTFAKIDDIESQMSRQLSALLQSLLRERTRWEKEARASRNIAEQLQDMKTAILSSIEAPEARDVARAYMRFRRALDFISRLQIENVVDRLGHHSMSWKSLMDEAQIDTIVLVGQSRRPVNAPRSVAFVRSDGRFFLRPIMTLRALREDLRGEIDEFASMPTKVKAAVLSAWDVDRRETYAKRKEMLHARRMAGTFHEWLASQGQTDILVLRASDLEPIDPASALWPDAVEEDEEIPF